MLMRTGSVLLAKMAQHGSRARARARRCKREQDQKQEGGGAKGESGKQKKKRGGVGETKAVLSNTGSTVVKDGE